MRNRCAQNIKRGSKIQVAHLLPGGMVGFGHGFAARKSAYHVYQHIEPALAVDHRAERAIHRRGLREVHRQRKEIGKREILPRDAARCADNRRAGCQETLCDKGAQASFCSGDQYYSFAHSPPMQNLIALSENQTSALENWFQQDLFPRLPQAGGGAGFRANPRPRTSIALTLSIRSVCTA